MVHYQWRHAVDARIWPDLEVEAQEEARWIWRQGLASSQQARTAKKISPSELAQVVSLGKHLASDFFLFYLG
jgi:hypothetical protein